MELTARYVGDVAILDLSGRLALPDGGSRLRSELERLLGARHKRIVINLQDVPYVDSSGLGDLLAAKKAALLAGAQIKLLRPNKRVYSLIAETGLSRVFECFEDEPSAVRSFGAERRIPRG